MSERVRLLAFRGIIAALTLIAVVPAITTVAFVFGQDLPAAGIQVAVTVARALATFSAAALASVLAWRAAHREDVRMLALMVAIWPTMVQSTTYYLPGVPHWVVAVISFVRATDWWMPFVAIAAFARLSALFPVPLDPEALGPPPRKWTLRWIRRVRLATLRPREVWGLTLAISIATLVTLGWLAVDPEDLTAVFPFLVGICFLSAMEAGVRNLLHSYRRADPEQRKRAFWLFEGLLLFVAGIVVIPALVGAIFGASEAFELTSPEILGASEILDNAALVAAVICFAFGTFYRGALDPRLLVRNTAIYGVLAIVLLVGFVGLENLVASQISRALGLSSGVGTWITGIIAALSITPLHGWLRRKILPPTRYNDPVFAPAEVDLSLRKSD